METTATVWKKCSSCKKDIPYRGRHYVCSVSTCNTTKLGLAFCSVACWDAHLGFANHRSADAIEKTAPSREEALATADAATAPEPQRRIVTRPSSTPVATHTEDVDTLVVVSKVKKLIRDRSDFNVSQDCIEALTEKVVAACLSGIEQARAAGRKTVMGRDIV